MHRRRIDFTENTLNSETFTGLGIDETIDKALSEAGITSPFPIQAMCIPLALEGQDLIGQAKTGTGKTLGFGLPIVQRVQASQDRLTGRLPAALVVVPTRELCLQVTSDLQVASKHCNLSVVSIFGGRAYEPQIDQLAAGVDIVVGTPGRLLDLARQRKLDLSKVSVLVLDEADEMLDMGFLPDVEAIIERLPTARQTMLFSATMPGQIINLARRYMSSPTHIRASDPNDEDATVEAIEQHVWRAHSLDKPEVIARVLQADGRDRVMIFCRTKRAAQKLADDLTERGFACGAIHGDLGQSAREKALANFRAGTTEILVATDVAARGIDVDNVTHVINYSCPEDEKAYLHRIGRTGRAGNDGVAVTLVDWDDVPRWKMINQALGLAFKEPVETYSTSPHIYRGLNIPEDAKGRLKPAAKSHAPRDKDAPARNRQRNRRSGSDRASRGEDSTANKSTQGPKKSRNRRRTRGGRPQSDGSAGNPN